MRVGFDTSPLDRPFPPGVVRVVRGTIEALERRGTLEVVRLSPPEGHPLGSWRRRELPRAVEAQDLVGLHSFLSAFPLGGPGRRVQTIHELPWRHGVRENADLRHRFWARLGPLRADRVVCPSERVARDLRRWPSAAKLRVVPWGVEPRFAPDPPPGVIDELVLERHRLGDRPLLVVLGGVRAKKNLAAVLAGLAERLRRGEPPLELVVTGPETADLRRDLGSASRAGLARWISTPGEVDDADLPALLRLASCVAVLSRSEGFALPVLEALACGTPVLVPPASAQAEVAGEAGTVVDPEDAGSVADGLARAVAGREAVRYTLPEAVAGLTWDACAQRLEALWKELA